MSLKQNFLKGIIWKSNITDYFALLKEIFFQGII